MRPRADPDGLVVLMLVQLTMRRNASQKEETHPMNRLEGKVALITGGARGMGAAHARAFVSHGAKVVIGDVLDETGQALADELGAEAEYIHLDVTNERDWARAVELAVSRFGGLSVLVNNAGIVNLGAIGEYSRDQWDLIVAINLTGPFLGITAARDALVASAPSSIVNISSIAGMMGTPKPTRLHRVEIRGTWSDEICRRRAGALQRESELRASGSYQDADDGKPRPRRHARAARARGRARGSGESRGVSGQR